MSKLRKRPKSILRLRVKGPHIRPGRIPIPELLVICDQAQATVNRQAEVLRGKRGLRPGPTATLVKAECTLELFSIGRGSAVMSFAGPESKQEAQADLLGLDVEKLGEAAVREVVTSLRAVKRGKTPVAMDVGVKRSLQELGRVLANGVSEIEWIAPALRGKRPRLSATFDEHIRARLDDEVRPNALKPMEIDGRLEMADFKVGDLKCIINAPGGRVTCTFSSDIEDDIYQALRHVARISGIATINPNTKRPEQITISSVKVLNPLLEPIEGFFSSPSLEQLTRVQGVNPAFDLRTVKDAWPEDDDVEKFVAAADQSQR